MTLQINTKTLLSAMTHEDKSLSLLLGLDFPFGNRGHLHVFLLLDFIEEAHGVQAI